MRFVVHSLFAFLATATLLVCGSVCVSAVRMVGQPFVGVSIVDEGLVNPAGFDAWGARSAGFHFWDRIIAVDGELVFSKDDVVARALSRPPGSPVVYQVQGLSDDTRFVQLATRVFTAGDLVRGHTSQAFLGLLFVAIAVALYVLRPGTAESWSFFALFASIGVSLASVADMTLMWRLPPFFPLLAPYLGSLGLVLVGIITRGYSKVIGLRAFQGNLEHGDPGFKDDGASHPNLPQRGMWALTLVCFGVSTFIAVQMRRTKGDVHSYVRYDGLLYAWLGFGVFLGLALLTVAYLRGRSPRRRARIRQILWAWPVGAGIPICNLFLGHVLELSPFSLIWNGFLLLVPISTADAIVRHDLLRLNATARRLVGGLTVAAVVGIALGLTLWFAVQFLKVNDAAAMVALAALLFAVAAPLSHRLQTHVESLLRQKRYDAGRLLAAFTARASTATHLPDVLERLKVTFEQSIQPQGFTLYRLEKEPLRLVQQGNNANAVVLVDDVIGPWLERADPWVVDDDQPAPPSLGASALAVRLAVANEPVGMLVVGHRPQQVPYEAADVGFVLSLAGPLAAALVNALAFDAVERLNRELERRVAARTAELEAKNSELALLNQRKDELVATVSHDFRSPLTVIKQNVQTILRDLPSMDHADVRAFVEAIARQEDRLTSLCTNLLDLARLRQRLEPQDPVRMDSLVDRIVNDLQLRAQARRVALAVTCDARAPVIVRGDATRLAQVLQNLIDNALKFTDAGGSINVALTACDDTRLRICVTDTGCGVPADAVGRLFEPFFQVPSAVHAGQGSGLGLAIVKAVVDAHHGALSVTSELGRGTAVQLLLPAQHATTTAAALAHGDASRVVVVYNDGSSSRTAE